jgi:hypothetical protein
MKKCLWMILTGILFFAPPSLGLMASEENEILAEIKRLEKDPKPSGDHARLTALLKESLLSYEGVKNYKAIFHKTERSDSGPGALEKIYLKFEKPWKIYMGWLNTHKKGLQVVYERGRHDGKLVIHKPGLLLGLMPVVFLDQNSPWVREGSASYDIEDAGIGTFLTDFSKAVARGLREKKLKVEFGQDKKVEVIFTDSEKNEDYFAYRIRVLFDEQNKLPVWMELFDWQDRLIGVYEYQDLEINVENDEEFKKQINRHLFKIYNSSTPPAPAKVSKNFSPKQ